MKEKYTSNEEKMRIITDYESRGFILVGDNGSVDGNYLEFQNPPQPSEVDILREQVARGNVEILEAVSLMLGGLE